jgi:hypothetical protein
VLPNFTQIGGQINPMMFQTMPQMILPLSHQYSIPVQVPVQLNINQIQMLQLIQYKMMQSNLVNNQLMQNLSLGAMNSQNNIQNLLMNNISNYGMFNNFQK